MAENTFTWVNLHCCIQDHYSAYSLMVYRWQSRLHVVLVEHHHYTSCLALYMKSCYSCAGIQYWLLLVIDHYYCFVSDLLSVSLVAQELTAVSEKWQYIGKELGVEQYLLWDISTKHSDPAWWLSKGGAEGTLKKLCHHLGWYYCSSQVFSYRGLSTGR